MIPLHDKNTFLCSSSFFIMSPLLTRVFCTSSSTNIELIGVNLLHGGCCTLHYCVCVCVCVFCVCWLYLVSESLLLYRPGEPPVCHG